MFDRTTVNAEVAPAYPQKIDIHNPASADMARLYGELMEKARAELVNESAGVLPSNVIQAVTVRRRYGGFKEQVVVCFMLNDEPHYVNADLSIGGSHNKHAQEVAETVGKYLGELIAEAARGQG